MALISWVIGGLIVIVVLAMLIGVFGVFLYDQVAAACKSVTSAAGQLKSGLKKS